MAWRRAISKNLREIRIHLCQSSKSSRGVRDFLEKHYVELKQQNPTFPFLVRECSGIEPKLYGRYEYGMEKCVSLSDMTSDEVLKTLELLVSKGEQKEKAVS